jgi:SNF2 family DNA or RNA helicase
VFLISLKAGGTGLNLTGADTVVHFDPWWNPAAEAQATDRAHRIGQTRVVTSYKLICAGTVEEKVLQMQAVKRALLADVFEASDSAAARLSLADLRTLLE